jgi:hypothetical protein
MTLVGHCKTRRAHARRVSIWSEPASARVDINAGNAQFHAGPSIAVLVVVAVAVDPLVYHLVPVALIEAPRSAEVVAANFTAHSGNRLGDAELLGRTLQAGRARRSSGIRLT